MGRKGVGKPALRGWGSTENRKMTRFGLFYKVEELLWSSGSRFAGQEKRMAERESQ